MSYLVVKTHGTNVNEIVTVLSDQQIEDEFRSRTAGEQEGTMKNYVLLYIDVAYDAAVKKYKFAKDKVGGRPKIDIGLLGFSAKSLTDLKNPDTIVDLPSSKQNEVTVTDSNITGLK